MNTRTITPGELATGQHITILEEIEEGYEDAMFSIGGSRTHQLVGVPLQVVAIDLPFVVTRLPLGQRFTLDTRSYRLMELKPEFVKAFAPEPTPPSNPAEHPQFGALVNAHNQLADQVFNLARKLPATQPPRPWYIRHAWDLGWFILIATACLLSVYTTHA